MQQFCPYSLADTTVLCSNTVKDNSDYGLGLWMLGHIVSGQSILPFVWCYIGDITSTKHFNCNWA